MTNWTPALISAGTINIDSGVPGTTGISYSEIPEVRLHPNKKVTVYHGTRLPMETICKYGVPGMTHEERISLLQKLCERIKEVYSIDLNYAHAPTHRTPGVFVSDSFEDVKDFAICAPSYLSDAIDTYFSGVDKKKLDKATIKILDNIGSPKILECSIPRRRFAEGEGGYGSVVDHIELEDIRRIYVFKYKSPHVDIEKLREARPTPMGGTFSDCVSVRISGNISSINTNGNSGYCGFFFDGDAGSISADSEKNEEEEQKCARKSFWSNVWGPLRWSPFRARA